MLLVLLVLALHVPVYSLPCEKTALPASFTVTNTAEASRLASAVNCEGGTFNAAWAGIVTVKRPIVVGNGTSLTITAANALMAVVDGGNSTQLFRVDAGELNLKGLILQNAFNDLGSAVIYAGESSILRAADCDISDSSGALGAIAIEKGSSLSLTRCTLSRNLIIPRKGGQARTTGGCVIASTGSVMDIRDSTFANNTANFGAGGLLVGGKLTAVNSTFIGHKALGGAVMETGRGSEVTITNCTFSFNQAGEHGGVMINKGLLLVENSIFTGNAAGYSGATLMFSVDGFKPPGGAPLAIVRNCTFAYNGATFGGAIFNYRDNILIEDSLFTGNVGLQDGGAFDGYEESTTTFVRCTFNQNTAHDGGAFLSKGKLILRDCTMSEQSAIGSGGVVRSLAESTVSATRCAFTGNSAGSGSAIFTSGNITITQCVFDQQKASVSGAAIYSTKGANSSIFTSNFTAGIASFGGALYFENSTALIDTCAFKGNTARTAGGAMYCDDCTVTTLSSTFNNNNCSSGDGGAAYIQGAASFTGCIFESNDAVAHGGAILNTEYSDTLLIDSKFTLNTAGRAGAAVFTNGHSVNNSAFTFSNTTSFDQNAASCCYAQGYGSSLKSDAPYNCQDTDSGGERGAACCTGGQYTNGTQCLACNREFDCTKLGTTTATLPLRPGYWRADLKTEKVLECWDRSACKGGAAISSVEEYCALGYGGPYCAVCSPGYSKSINYSCSKCEGGYKTGVLGAIGVIIVLIGFLLFILVWELLELGDGTDASEAVSQCNFDALKHFLEAIPWNKIRTPLVVFQILTQYIGITGLKVPLLYRDFLAWIDAVNIDLSWILSVGCVVQVDFYQRLLLNTLAPFGFALFLCCTYSIVYWRHRLRSISTTTSSKRKAHISSNSNDRDSFNDLLVDDNKHLEKAFAKHAMVFLTMTFLIYSTVSTTVFQTFACDAISDSNTYLRADYSISCNTRQHTWYKIYSGLMILIYPVGIPSLYAYVLWRQRAALNPKDTSAVEDRDNQKSLRKTRFLWQTYKPSLFYWEVVECMRRLLLTGTMVFVYPAQTAQPAIACLLAFGAIVIVLWWDPHAEVLDSRIYVFGSIIVFLSMFLSLLVKVQDGADIDFEGSKTYSATLVALNVLMIAAAFTQLIYVGRRAYQLRTTITKIPKSKMMRKLTAKTLSTRTNDSDDVAPSYSEAISSAYRTDSAASFLEQGGSSTTINVSDDVAIAPAFTSGRV